MSTLNTSPEIRTQGTPIPSTAKERRVMNRTQISRPTEQDVKTYMTREYRDHIDPICGDLNLTGMVEDALQHFPTLDGTSEAPVWDWAVEVEQRLVRLGCAQPIIREA